MVELDGVDHALVMGLGRFGGGSGAARYLLDQGCRLVITDLQERRELADAVEALDQGPGADRIEWRLGGHEISDFRRTDLIVASPAIPRPWKNRFLASAREAGIPITTEIELGLGRIDQTKLIGVTGSAGKSTTCAMIHHVLNAAGKHCILGGNIGGSLLEHPVEHLRSADAVVVELSSFMLHWLADQERSFRPAVGVLTTLSANHLDWHDSLAHYLASKRVLRDSVPEGRFIAPLNPEDVAAVLVGDESVDGWWAVSDDDPFMATDARRSVLDELDLPLPGEHQRTNALNALRAVATYLEGDPDRRVDVAKNLAKLLVDFKGLPHRLNPVAEIGGIRVIDDSKATTPSATLRAVHALGDTSRIHLIAGGFDKGSDLSELDALGNRLAGLYAIGATAGSISSGRQAHRCGTIDEAVRLAATLMSSGDVLLLSPGCASWDQFDNYEHRGEVFLAAVIRYLD